LAANILVGSVPGVILGSNMSVKWPQGLLRTILGVVLIAAGLAILNKANTDLVPYTIGFAGLSFAALFVIQLGLRREVEQDPAEQEWMRRAAMVASHGDEIERYQRVESATPSA
jgi:sulfite exporter TauE/SafE